jgi:GTP-binding protein EngB required for normal cell division
MSGEDGARNRGERGYAPAAAGGEERSVMNPWRHPGLNENHIRRILTTFGYVDDLLRSVDALAHPDGSPFAREHPDLSPDEARLLLSFVSGARARMIAALDRLDIPRPEQSLSARRSVSTALVCGEIALSELEARALRGYGALDPAAGAEITALASDLQSLLRRGAALLREHEAGGLAEKLARIPGPAGTVVRSISRISTEHGLAEVRPLLAAAAERALGTRLDVGVFGRVSSGKSSLINALVGGDVLPVGATPVTAVPVRIRRGHAAVEVRFRDGRAESTSVAELPAYATEEQNPRNRRDVVSIEVSVPSAPPGLRFLDTPGVGSLNASGSAQAFAWLPRCDLGVVLVAAGTPLGRDETALVSGLRHAGIECRVLVSKADLLAGKEVEEASAYVRAEIAPLVGPRDPVEVLAVSTRPGCLDGLRRLQREVLEPLASDHVRRARRAVEARLRRLVAITAAALDGGRAGQGIESAEVDLEKRRAVAADAIRGRTDALATSARDVLEEMAGAVSACWANGEDGARAARMAIQRGVGRAITSVREAIEGASAAAAGSGPVTRRVPPLFDPELLDALRELPPPRLLPGILRAGAARRAVAPLLPHLQQALPRFAARLRAWGEGELAELQASPGPPGSAGARSGELAALEPLLDAIGPDGAHDSQGHAHSTS